MYKKARGVRHQRAADLRRILLQERLQVFIGIRPERGDIDESFNIRCTERGFRDHRTAI